MSHLNGWRHGARIAVDARGRQKRYVLVDLNRRSPCGDGFSGAQTAEFSPHLAEGDGRLAFESTPARAAQESRLATPARDRDRLARAALRGPASASARNSSEPPAFAQAVFCIDVRSEVFRRALEAQSPTAQTLGFAASFGCRCEYLPWAPRAPPPAYPLACAPMRATDRRDPPRRSRRAAQGASRRRGSWTRFKTGALSSFAFVEAMGLSFAGNFLPILSARARKDTPSAPAFSTSEHAARKPRLAEDVAGRPLGVPAARRSGCSIAPRDELTRNFARLVAVRRSRKRDEQQSARGRPRLRRLQRTDRRG